jgi:hypothetical protein
VAGRSKARVCGRSLAGIVFYLTGKVLGYVSGWSTGLLCSECGVQTVRQKYGAFRPSNKFGSALCLHRKIADWLLLVRKVTGSSHGRLDGVFSSTFLYCIFLDAALCCSRVSGYQRLGRKCCLHLQGLSDCQRFGGMYCIHVYGWSEFRVSNKYIASIFTVKICHYCVRTLWGPGLQAGTAESSRLQKQRSTQSTAHSHSTIKCNLSVTITKKFSLKMAQQDRNM